MSDPIITSHTLLYVTLKKRCAVLYHQSSSLRYVGTAASSFTCRHPDTSFAFEGATITVRCTIITGITATYVGKKDSTEENDDVRILVASTRDFLSTPAKNG